MNFVEAFGLKEEEEENKEDTKEVDLESLRVLKKVGSEGPDPDLDPKFSRGDEVTVVRRVSWLIPQKGNSKYRKDFVEGTSGVVQGWADLEQRSLLLTVILDLLAGKRQEVTKEIFPRNLKLTSEYNSDHGIGEEPSISSADQKEKGGPPAWALLDSEASCVKVLSTCKDLKADQDKCSKIWQIKGSIAVSLKALGATLPSYTDKDFVVVNRKNQRASGRVSSGPREPLSLSRSSWAFGHHRSKTLTS